jgi:acid phosphatase family membrane protein YuiD
MNLGVPLISAIVVQVICQLFKVGFYSIRRGSFRPDYFVQAGGMPSAHSAMVTTLTTSLGLYNGLSSPCFAVAAVFSLIIIYDAVRLRAAVQLHAEILRRLVRHFPGEAELGMKINARSGHSPAEVAAGVAVGLVFALLAYRLFPAGLS